MRQLGVGEKIGECDCPSCAAKIPVKVGKNGTVYVYCTNVIAEENGKKERCFFRTRYGRTASKKMTHEFLTKENEQHVEFENRQDEPAAPGIGHNGGPVLEENVGTVHSHGKPAGLLDTIGNILFGEPA